MCGQEYRPCGAVQCEIAQALLACGLTADFTASSRRPPPAATLPEQLERVAIAMRVVAAVRRRLPVDLGRRRYIERVVDHAIVARSPRAPRAVTGATSAAVIAYAAAGGGMSGSFAEFRMRFTGDDLQGPHEDDVEPVVMPAPQARPQAATRRPQAPVDHRLQPSPKPPLVIRRRRAAAHG